MDRPEIHAAMMALLMSVSEWCVYSDIVVTGTSWDADIISERLMLYLTVQTTDGDASASVVYSPLHALTSDRLVVLLDELADAIQKQLLG
jgi:hypothetical protein